MRKAIWTLRLVFAAAVVLTVSCASGGPAPSGAPGEGAAGGGAERLLLSEAVEQAKAHLDRLGYPEAQLWRLEGGLALDQNGRAVWKFHLCDPASQRDILYDFEYAEEDQRAAVVPGEMSEPCTPLAGIAPPEQVAAGNPRIWQLVAEKEEAAQQLLADFKEQVEAAAEQAGFPGAPEELFQVKVGIGLAPFTGPSPSYEHGRDAWVVIVDYPTEVDEQDRVVSEQCRFWAALDTGDPIYDECAGDEGGAEGEQPVPPPPGEEEAVSAPLQWRQYEDFQFGDPLSRWQLSPPGGCEPTSSEVEQTVAGSLRQGARGGGMDGKDCVGLNATRDFSAPPGLMGSSQPVIAFSWRVPEFSSPDDPHGGKEGYADLLVIPLDGQGQELGRLRFRVSCDDRSGDGTSYCSPSDYGMRDGSSVVLVHGQGQEANWQYFSAALGPGDLRTPGISPDRAAAIDWSRMATLRLVFEFAAGYLYNDAWAVEWDDLVTWDVVKESAATLLSVPPNVTVVDRGTHYTFADVDEVRNSADVGNVTIGPSFQPPDFELDLDLNISFAAARSFKKSDTAGATRAFTKGYLLNISSPNYLPAGTTVWSCLDKYIQVSDAPPSDAKLVGFQVEPHGTYRATLTAVAAGGVEVWFDVDVQDLTDGRLVAGDTIDAGVVALFWATNVVGDIYERGLNARSINPGAFPTDDFWFPRFPALPGHEYRISICTKISTFSFAGSLYADVNNDQRGLWLDWIDLRPVSLPGGGGGCGVPVGIGGGCHAI